MNGDKINGRTPEEIKMGLECCACDDGTIIGSCGKCPYYSKSGMCGHIFDDVLAYIQQLERERDAAVEYLAVTRYCMSCIYNNVLKCDKCKGCFMTTTRPNWKWRGVPQEEVEE